MSIVPVKKVTFYGLFEEKEQVLSELQDFGCLHIVPLTDSPEIGTGDSSPQAREALKFLLTCPQRRRQVHYAQRFDAEKIVQQTLTLHDKIRNLEDERDFLRNRIEGLRPWGDFAFPSLDKLKNLRLWFYLTPHHKMKDVEQTPLCFQVVDSDERFVYVVVISEEEPQGMPVERTHTGEKPLSDLERRLEQVEIELEDLQAERLSLTRWCDLFASSLARLEDQEALAIVAHQTYDESSLFALQAWASKTQIALLREYANERHLALVVEEPSPQDTPPTLLRNPKAIASGEDLITFYTTPGYHVWDPSTIVFFSFALFFAMILADAGYGLVLGLILALLWKRMSASSSGRRFRNLFTSLVGASVLFGILVGSYFGLAAPEGSLLDKLKVLEMRDFATMMTLSILIGVSHLVLASAVTAWYARGSQRAFAPLGWAFIWVGGATLWLGGANEAAKGVGFVLMVVGGVLILLFNSQERSIVKRLLGGLQGVTKLTSAFGDTLSYLRLFALGLASASLATTFNDLAKQVDASVSGVGMLFALLILLLGHGLNFVLSLSSGVIHGLRLNVIEFLNWSLSDEGTLFKAFLKKEKQVWTR